MPRELDMGTTASILIAAAVLFMVGVTLIWRPIRAAWREARFAEARRDFHRQRERLEAKFVQLGATGKAGTARWVDCDFDDDVAYARSRSTRQLCAFVAVTIEMDEGGEPSVGIGDAVGNLRAATAVFRFDKDRWETDGRAIFNLTPTETIHFYQRDLEMVAREVAGR
jgi:hypothetical protein